MSFFFKWSMTQFLSELPSLGPWSLLKKLIILNLLYENIYKVFCNKSISDKSISNENTL